MLTWLRKHTKTIMIVVVVIFAASMFYGLGYRGLKGEAGPAKTIAKVNGQEIDLLRYQEFLKRVAQSFGANVSPSNMAFLDSLALNQAIDFTLMLKEAKKKVKVSGAEIDGALQSIMNQQKIPSKRELELALKGLGLSLGEFRALIRDDLRVQKLQMKFAEETRLTPADLRQEPRWRKLDEKTALREKQEKTFRRWFSEIKGKAKVEIINPILKGHDYRFKGQIQAALTEYQKAARQLPANPAIHIYLGDTYLSLGRPAQALAEYENAVKMEGGNPELYIILGNAYEKAGKRSLAADQFKRASLVAGDNKTLHERLLKIFQGLKRSAEIARENAEIRRLEKKEKFEKDLKG